MKAFSQTVEQGWLLGPDEIGPWKSFCVELSNFLMERNLEATAQKGDSFHPYFFVLRLRRNLGATRATKKLPVN